MESGAPQATASSSGHAQRSQQKRSTRSYIVKGADAIEAYDQLRYFTVTGRGKGDIGDGQAVIDWLVQEYLSEPQRPTHTTGLQTSATENLNAGEVTARIRASKQAAKFNALMARQHHRAWQPERSRFKPLWCD